MSKEVSGTGRNLKCHCSVFDERQCCEFEYLDMEWNKTRTCEIDEYQKRN